MEGWSSADSDSVGRDAKPHSEESTLDRLVRGAGIRAWRHHTPRSGEARAGQATKCLTRRQSQRSGLSRLLLRRSRASHSRGSSLTLGKGSPEHVVTSSVCAPVCRCLVLRLSLARPSRRLDEPRISLSNFVGAFWRAIQFHDGENRRHELHRGTHGD